MGYWDATNQYLNQHGRGPTCPHCGATMFPQDDHGRFTCFCNLGRSLDVISGTELHPLRIPQVDATGMSDEEKANIDPINRLGAEPTAAESKVLSMLLSGPDVMDSPEYVEACKKLDEERNK